MKERTYFREYVHRYLIHTWKNCSRAPNILMLAGNMVPLQQYSVWTKQNSYQLSRQMMHLLSLWNFIKKKVTSISLLTRENVFWCIHIEIQEKKYQKLSSLPKNFGQLSRKPKFNLSCLPPMLDYILSGQVQTWLSIRLKPEYWG